MRLCEVNPRYEDRIERGRLQHSRLTIVDPRAFEGLQLLIAREAHSRGISAVQTKVPRLLAKEEHIALLRQHARGSDTGPGDGPSVPQP
ncbi:MAG: GH3 auxin-responsive promoter family protein, partial [Candidatus Devosia euplotis]|nr:GH3 auxin-responsive promoter family protein [Candidatus Devosia euplotis]